MRFIKSCYVCVVYGHFYDARLVFYAQINSQLYKDM